MLTYFNTYRSNTLAGSGNQLYFCPADDSAQTRCCLLYRVFASGRYDYSFLFSNIIDSTYGDGSICRKNFVVGPWVMDAIRVGVTAFCCEERFDMPCEMRGVTVAGQEGKIVNPGEVFCTDPISIEADAGEYICLEIRFHGAQIPYHEESIIPSFVYENGAWIPSKHHPFASMIGANRAVKARIAFLGDSITQGCGTPINGYAHWNAVLADGLGDGYAYWNLGLGYGRADDAASDGAWLYKAKQNDIVLVCYGVNDIIQGFDAASIKRNLATIVSKLKAQGITVVVQTIPPFDYGPTHRAIWEEVNAFLLGGMTDADFVFDCVKVLCKSAQEPHMAGYGAHPGRTGCRLWAEALLSALLEAGIVER